jgi:hypothetical protein
MLFDMERGPPIARKIVFAHRSQKGLYLVRKLIAKHGRKGNMSAWVSDLKGDCPKRDAAGLQDRCDVVCPDLPKVL